jgi:staphylococcal nuclease domain-containing protein 1
LTAPRLGTSTREDEVRPSSFNGSNTSKFYQRQPWAFESREFLRALTVGKEISFTSIHSLPSNDDIPRDLGHAEVAGVDLTSELLRNGWAKLKEIKREPSEEDNRKKEIENEAKAAGKGIWNPHGQQVGCINSCFLLLDLFEGACSSPHDAR